LALINPATICSLDHCQVNSFIRHEARWVIQHPVDAVKGFSFHIFGFTRHQLLVSIVRVTLAVKVVFVFVIQSGKLVGTGGRQRLDLHSRRNARCWSLNCALVMSLVFLVVLLLLLLAVSPLLSLVFTTFVRTFMQDEQASWA